jgi:aspartyl protease family protein
MYPFAMGRGLLIYVFVFGAIMSCVANLPSRGSHSIEMHSAKEAALTADSSSSDDSSSESYSGNAITLDRQWDGHFYADAEVNGQTIHFLVDTGASVIALSRDDARRAGMATSIAMPEVVGEGASGAVHGEVARIDRISLGPASDRDIAAIILDDGDQSLLGQSFLRKFASVEIRGDRMVLQ